MSDTHDHSPPATPVNRPETFGRPHPITGRPLATIETIDVGGRPGHVLQVRGTLDEAVEASWADVVRLAGCKPIVTSSPNDRPRIFRPKSDGATARSLYALLGRRGAP